MQSVINGDSLEKFPQFVIKYFLPNPLPHPSLTPPHTPPPTSPNWQLFLIKQRKQGKLMMTYDSTLQWIFFYKLKWKIFLLNFCTCTNFINFPLSNLRGESLIYMWQQNVWSKLSIYQTCELYSKIVLKCVISCTVRRLTHTEYHIKNVLKWVTNYM